MKVLVVEDDRDLSQLLQKQLEKNHFAVDVVHNGEDGIFQASEIPYDCIILDINLPDIDGFTVCQTLRDQKIKIPILMLTARDAITDRVKGLNLGADDYVSKPVDTQELVARVRALIRRNNKEELPVLQIADLQINPQTREVSRGGIAISLNPKEYSVLEYLAFHYDEVVTRSMIMEHVWGSDFESLSNVVDVYIRYLRIKIDTRGLPPLIHTIRGGGYRLSGKKLV